MSSFSLQLWNASATGNVSVVKSCLLSGDNINFSYKDGLTPLLAACLHNHPKVVRELLAIEDVDLVATNTKGMTAMHLACQYGSVECIRIMGGDWRMTEELLNIKNMEGRTALMEAVLTGQIACVKVLENIDGVDWATENADHESLEEVARKENHEAVLDYLQLRNNETPLRLDLPINEENRNLNEISEELENNSPFNVVNTDMNGEMLEELESNSPTNIELADMNEMTAMLNIDYQNSTENEDLIDLSDITEVLESIQSLNLSMDAERKSFEEKQRKDKENFEKGQKEEKDDFNCKQERKIKRRQELEVKLEENLPSAPTAAPNLIPECPVCYESMAPPVKIYNCQNGHFVCNDCKPRLSTCTVCRSSVLGRATGMEQMLRKMAGVE